MNKNSLRKILVVEDEEGLREVMKIVLTSENYKVFTAKTGNEALEMAQLTPFDLIITDVRLPGISGIQLMERIKEKNQKTVFVVISAYGSVELAVEAMRKGAFHFLPKPFNKDAFIEVIHRVEEHLSLIKENQELKTRLRIEKHTEIIGNSLPIEKVKTFINKIAKYKTTVLITGESGTGKELIARQIHEKSGRAGPFVPVNCGAIPRELLESELFGYVKGAFTGADKDNPGLFRESENGTLFLDEIGELPLDLQVKLLRALQENAIRPVGGNQEIKIDVRVIAATSRNLEKEVSEGNFRADLYYRLNVVPIKVPPLRERTEDIPLLVHHFLKKASKEMKIPEKTFSKKALSALMSYDWPGNIRELQNIVEQVTILSDKNEIDIDDLPDKIRAYTKTIKQYKNNNNKIIPKDVYSIKQACKIIEKELIIKALKRTKGNKSAAARLLEISIKALQYKIKDYGIEDIK